MIEQIYPAQTHSTLPISNTLTLLNPLSPHFSEDLFQGQTLSTEMVIIYARTVDTIVERDFLVALVRGSFRYIYICTVRIE